jgi:KipI family sensor histidine kinase inhibitor
MGVVTIRDAGDAAMLLELEPTVDPVVNARALSIAAAVRGRGLAGVRAVVTTYRSVAVYFDPLVADVEMVRATLGDASDATAPVVQGRTCEIPVAYGGEYGPDLGTVAAINGLSEAEVIARHVARPYRVFMLGFQPGFPYLGQVDERIAAPRLPRPRLRVPPGSVGIGGTLTGIYPGESPGGWQIIGRTPATLFDPDRDPSALLAPGDTVRFVPGDAGGLFGAPRSASPSVRVITPHGGRLATVVKPGLFTTVQDEGRWGHLGEGVPVSGALDVASHRIANGLAGNHRTAATLEVTIAGLELRFEQPTRLGLAGADLSARIDGVDVRPPHAIEAPAGSVLHFGARRLGARAYVACDGGIDVPPVMGSRATSVGCAIGGVAGRALKAGDRLPLGAPAHPRARRSDAVVPLPASGARLRVLPGPQSECFTDDALDVLQRSRYRIAPESNRMGYRLSDGPRVPCRLVHPMISDATFAGALQVPESGEPILLLTDRQTTGGYPQIATVISADLPLAGQLAPGDWVEFRVCTRAEAIAALVTLEGKLLALNG